MSRSTPKKPASATRTSSRSAWTLEEEDALLDALRDRFGTEFHTVVYERKSIPSSFWEELEASGVIGGRTAGAVKAHFRQSMRPVLKSEKERDPKNVIPLTTPKKAKRGISTDKEKSPTANDQASDKTKDDESSQSLPSPSTANREDETDENDPEQTDSDVEKTTNSVEPEVVESKASAELATAVDLMSDNEDDEQNKNDAEANDTNDVVLIGETEGLDTQAEVYQVFFVLVLAVLLYFIATAEEWGGVSPAASRNIPGFITDLIAKWTQ